MIHRALQDQSAGEAAFIRSQEKASAESRVARQLSARELEYAEGVAPEQHGLVSPDLKGVRADVQRQIDRRLRKYGSEPEELSLGRVTKKVSELDWSSLEQGLVSVDMKKVAGKL